MLAQQGWDCLSGGHFSVTFMCGLAAQRAEPHPDFCVARIWQVTQLIVQDQRCRGQCFHLFWRAPLQSAGAAGKMHMFINGSNWILMEA